MLLEPKDFPQMWQKPSSDDLLNTLKQLELSPPIWSHKRRRSDIIHEQEATVYFRREVSMYLSSIIKSSLSWIEDADEKEEIWSEASRRMAERCGRTAMGEITRQWPFREDALTPTFELIIREPPLTGDSLGHKTWGSSYVLAQHLPSIGSTALFRLFDESLGQPRPSVLELGSGTGLLGLAAAALWKVHVILSDLPDIMSNLQHNVEANRATVEKFGGSLNAGALTWGGSGENEVDQSLFDKKNQFKVVLAADPLYDDCHPGLLAGAFSQQLSTEDDARAVVMVPLRDETTKRLLRLFRDTMGSQEMSLVCIEEGTLDGQDDWGEAEEGTQVTCWWGIFARKQ
ncbi:Putative lysine methyltransferase, S-adenosyl-L-methionine-dependent methyltransferase superfamily [Colletotrichum destructivum]|uniref:Lysine methyltransferase, S-adenosyl-L-methionine-dependent methyltransferase superfamily n=1 Tax=Colletotrichum destructivum TaxID=34406 RepID=A0AAX4IV91_9PEZI|nr:Putative lysine methyltransferase, S-adenosyl-L-methionine-dependent methyltransferase superfamily [Colletotrichum destructivum]